MTFGGFIQKHRTLKMENQKGTTVSLRHWGATQMVAAKVDIKAAQQHLGHSRPTTLLIHYAQVLDESADKAAGLLSGKLG